MPRSKKQSLVGNGMNANLLKEFIDLSYKGNTSIAPAGYSIDAPLSDSRVKVYTKNGSNDKDVVITHRGSVGLDDWMDNASYLFRGKVKGTKTYNLHRERHKKAVEKYGAKNIIAIGHSRAGLYIQELQKEFPIKENITYNKASGFFDIGRQNDANQTDIRVGNDVVSLLAPLQKHPNTIVKIDGTKNPLDFNSAHQSSEIDKLGTTFIGKKNDPTEMVGGDRPMLPRTNEQLMAMIKTDEKRKTAIENGKVYKSPHLSLARINFRLAKCKELLKQQTPKAEEPKKEEPKKEEPKKVKLAPLQEIPAFKPKKVEPKKVAFPEDLKGKTKKVKPNKVEQPTFTKNYFFDLPEELQTKIKDHAKIPEVSVIVKDLSIRKSDAIYKYKVGFGNVAFQKLRKANNYRIAWVGTADIVKSGASYKEVVHIFRDGARPIPSNFVFYNRTGDGNWKEHPITEWNEIQKNSTEPQKLVDKYFDEFKKKKTKKKVGEGFLNTLANTDLNKVKADFIEALNKKKVGEGIQPRISGVNQLRKLIGVEERRLKRINEGTIENGDTEYTSIYMSEPKIKEKLSRLRKRLRSAKENKGHATAEFFVPKTNTWLKINKTDTYLNTPLKADGKHKLMLDEIEQRIADLKAQKEAKKKGKKQQEEPKQDVEEEIEEVEEEIEKVEEAIEALEEEPKKKLTKEERKKARLAKKKEYDRLRYLKIKAQKLKEEAKDKKQPEENVEIVVEAQQEASAKKKKFKDLTKEEQLAKKKEYDKLRYLKKKADAEAKALGKGFNKKQLTNIILDKNKVIADLEETAYGGQLYSTDYLDIVLDSNSTPQNMLIHSFKHKTKYIQPL